MDNRIKKRVVKQGKLKPPSRWAAGLAAFCSVLSLSAPAVAGEARFALVVGNNSGGRFEKDLRFAEDDAKKMLDVLVELGGFDRSRVRSLLGGDAEAVREAAGKMAAEVRETRGERSVFFFYYSGHADENGLKLGKSRLANAELKEILARSGAAVRIGIIDACNSGMLTRMKGGKGGPDFTVTLDAAPTQEGEVLITSSRGEEKALESDELKGSFFTHYLVSALRGDADLSGDGRVSLSEAYQYAYNRTVLSTASQHPSYDYRLKGAGEVVLTEPQKAESTLVFPAGLDGRFLVYRAGTLAVLAEVEKEGGSARKLSLPPGRYVVKKKEKDFVLIGKVALSAGESQRVNEAAMSRMSISEDFTKGPPKGPVWSAEGRVGMQAFLSARSRDEIASPLPVFGLAVSAGGFPFESADLRLDIGVASREQALLLADAGGRGFRMPMTLTETVAGLTMPFNLAAGPFRGFAGPRLSSLLIHRSFKERSEQFFVVYPGVQAGAGCVLAEYSLSVRLEVNINYIYVKLDQDVKNLGTVEPFLGVGYVF